MRKLIKTLGPLGLVLGAVATLPACGGKTGEICSLECDCSHCNDIIEERTCDQASLAQDVSSTYGCDKEFDALAQCIIDKGQCDEKTLNFSTAEQGSCSGTFDSGIPCTSDMNCLGFNNTTCIGGTCKGGKACSGNAMQQCQDDSECPGGKDRCQSEQEDLGKCIDKASDDPSAANFF